MNSKRAKELRRAARMLAGPEAPHTEYELEQQRNASGLPIPPTTALMPGESADGRVYTDKAGVPVCTTYGKELRNIPASVRAIYRKIKTNYRRIRSGGFKVPGRRL